MITQLTVHLGGVIGFYCRYPYSHTAANAAKVMPYALTGVDLVVHNVFRSLGLEVKVRPLLDQSELDDMDEFEYECDRDYYGEEPWEFPEYLPNQCRCACESPHGCSGGCSPYFPDFPSFEEWKARKQKGDLIGTEFRELQFCRTDEDAFFRRIEKESVSTLTFPTSSKFPFTNIIRSKELQATWEWKKYRNIKWLNTPEEREKGSPWELALHNIPYTDDETYIERFYSYVVLLIRVPKMVKRDLTVNA
jgi:hypothetical protein